MEATRNLGGLSGAMATAASGLQRQATQVSVHAENVVRRGAQESAALVEFSNEARGLAGGAAEGSIDAPDYAESVVGMIKSEHAFAANIKVLQTADSMASELLDIKA